MSAYPHFISSKPCGIDKYEGRSQERLTKAIADHIRKTDRAKNQYQVPRIIGLEGTWGAGKSNVIKQVKTELESDYYVFEYDAWGHQEDLQRRSFLETLTTELIKAELLNGDIEVTIGGNKKKITWHKKLNDLLAKRVTRVNKTIPKFNPSTLLTAFLLSLTPISTFISEQMVALDYIKNICYAVIIAFSPIIVGILMWIILTIRNKNIRTIGYLLQITKDENSETTNYETINEDEPTVAKFKAWMNDISDYIGSKSAKKLIVVFDNMDRLPADKVKELWSSIHTFFSEDGFENIWAIIPFDTKHLSCAFGEANNESNVEKERNDLTKYFIAKTFPIVYRVTPPVLTDYKNVFASLFREAFGDTENSKQEDINRIFRLDKPNSTIREMIVFINQLVSLKTVWTNDINILDIAVFCLKQDTIMKDPVNEILSGKFLGEDISKIIHNDSPFQKSMSALVYGISPDDAEQIPLSKYIENSLKSEMEYDINNYSSNKHFITLLDDTVKNIDISQIDVIIQNLSKLDITIFSDTQKDNIQQLWAFLVEQKTNESMKAQKLEESYKILLTHAETEYQEKIVRYVCSQIQYFAADKFNGIDYYTSLHDLGNFLNENSIDIHLELDTVETIPDVFVNYVWKSEENYQRYKLSTNTELLDEFFVALMPDKLSETKTVTLGYLDKKTYTFPKLIKSIENAITSDKITEKNVGEIIYIYKLVSDNKPLPIRLTDGRIKNLWATISARQGDEVFFDIASMQLAKGVNVSLNDTQIEKVAGCMDYYVNYGDLLISNLSWNIPSLSKVLKYMTENKNGYQLSLKDMLPQFFPIAKNIGVKESILISQLNRWGNQKESIDKSNITTIIPNAEFYSFSIEIKNELTDHINKIAIEALSEVSSDILHQQKNNSVANYWYIIIHNLIGTEFMQVLPDNLTELGKLFLSDIATKQLPVPVAESVLEKIISAIDRKKTSAQIKDIRDGFCNDIPITPQLFQYFEPWFKHQGDLMGGKADRVTHKIIQPVINDAVCLSLILSDPDYYSQIINNAGDDASELKDIISKKLESDTDNKLITFAKKIGISMEKK